MKLPSLQYLAQNARRSFLRFPFTIVSSLLAVGIAIFLNEAENEITNIFPYLNLMLCAALGISLFFCADVFAQSKGYTRKKQLLLDGAAALILVALYFTLPDSDSTQNTSVPYIRYAIYSITIHLLVAFVPFIGKGHLNGFWHYNRILFVRFLTSLLYSAFLYTGLALALGSLDFLFDIDLHNELFFDLFILITGFFNTWFFISGIPERFDTLEEIHEYPRGIKIFSQYVLLPLLILYLLILYIYAGKIVLQWNWPKGYVSYLVACVAVLGILTLLLIHPYGNLPGNSWIKRFSKIYYFILLPLIALLFIAIGMRIGDYGITINRYIILLLGVWLTIVCSYFIIGYSNIKFIPISLAAILVLMTFGYWGMFSVSERSQVARLRTILEQSKILNNGKIENELIWLKDSLPTLYRTAKPFINEPLLTDSLHNEVKSILDYLDNHHGFSSIRPWFRQDIDSLTRVTAATKEKWRNNEAEIYMESMELEYIHRYNTNDSYFTFSVRQDENTVVEISGYDYLVAFSEGYNDSKRSLLIADREYTLNFRDRRPRLSLISQSDTIGFDLGTVASGIISKYGRTSNWQVEASDMRVAGDSDQVDAKLELNTITIDNNTSPIKINHIAGNIFLREKKR